MTCRSAMSSTCEVSSSSRMSECLNRSKCNGSFATQRQDCQASPRRILISSRKLLSDWYLS